LVVVAPAGSLVVVSGGPVGGDRLTGLLVVVSLPVRSVVVALARLLVVVSIGAEGDGPRHVGRRWW